MELVQHLVDELGVSTRQAAGGAGLLLQLASERLEAEQFLRVAETTPAISDLIAKAPHVKLLSNRGIAQTMSRWLGGLGGLLAVVDGFARLGCDKTMVRGFAESLIEFFRNKAGEDVGSLLENALR